MNADFVTKVNEDWPEYNLLVLRDCVKRAVDDVRRITTQHPEFDSPNKRNVEGVIRWSFLDAEVERAVKAGLFSNLKGGWIDLGGVSVYEIRGIYSAVLCNHLSTPSATPRESTLRSNRRFQNEIAPLFPAFEDRSIALDAFSRVYATLVHGDKNAEFAYLRVYSSSSDGSFYQSVCQKNLMHLQGPSSIMAELDQEQIDEVVLRTRANNSNNVAKQNPGMGKSA